jgi:flavin-dependent dehydrogenase
VEAGRAVNSETFDLAVVGGGPAGASAAITAAKLGFRVALLEAGRFPRHKVCGEFVSGEALELLSNLVGESALIGSAPRISHARAFIDDRVLTMPVEPPAASIARFDLDAALWRAAQRAGVTCRDSVRVLHVRKSAEDIFTLKLQAGELCARSVINASGRWSSLTAGTTLSILSNKWLGVKAHFREERPTASCDLYFFKGGYCGVQPVGDGVVNASAMVRADVARNLATVFAQNRQLWRRSQSWVPESEPVSTAPLVFTEARTSQDGVLLCGDAAAFIDPFAGDGISMALHSGRLAAAALDPYLRGSATLGQGVQCYAESYRRVVQPTLKSAAALRRLLALPRPLRAAALALFSFGPLAEVAVRQTRVRIEAA